MNDVDHLLALEEQHYFLLAALSLLEDPEPEDISRRRLNTPRWYLLKPYLLGSLHSDTMNTVYRNYKERIVKVFKTSFYVS